MSGLGVSSGVLQPQTRPRAEIEERLVTIETGHVIQHTHLSERVVRAMDLGELFHWSASSVSGPIENPQIDQC
jgi:hypothetical protein